MMEEVKEKFEVIAKNEGLDVTRHKKHGYYLCRSTHVAWNIYKAAIFGA